MEDDGHRSNEHPDPQGTPLPSSGAPEPLGRSLPSSAAGSGQADASQVTNSLAQAFSEQAAQLMLPDRWQPIRLLGSGGQAEVWLALDRELDQWVALKLFSRQLPEVELRRFRREAMFGRTLEHPHLIRLYEVLRAGDRLGVAMEWCEDGSLARILESGPLPLDRVLEIAEQTLEAVAYLHDTGIVHRDIKPSNLLVRADKSIALADLGLARHWAGGVDETLTRSSVGTPRFMSPEQLRGERVGPPSDLYSFGVTLFNLLTGQPPFDRGTEFDVADGHLHRPPPDPRSLRKDCPRWLARFVLRLLEKCPEDRFPDGQAALEALRRHAVWLSPRRLRRMAGGLVLAVAIVAASSLIASRTGLSAKPVVAQVRFNGRLLDAYDAEGHHLWSYRCSSHIRSVIRAHLLRGDGRQIVAVTAPVNGNAPRGSTLPPASIVAVDQRGRLVTELLPEERVRARDVTRLAPPFLVPSVTAADLDGDGLDELLAPCHHRVLGTSYLFIYWPRQDVWRLPLSQNGGWIFNVAAVPGAMPPRLRFFAFNSLIGSMDVLGELVLPPPGAPLPSAGGSGLSGARAWEGARISWYTPLGQTWPDPVEGGFVVQPDGGMDLKVQGRHWHVDRWGNPVPGPNAGLDLSAQRMALLGRLSRINLRGLRSNTSSARKMMADLQREFHRLLREPMMEAVFSLAMGRAFAAAGDPRKGVRIMRRSWERTRNDGLGLAMAHLQAISGDLGGAASTLRGMIARSKTPSGMFRACELLRRVAIELNDPAMFEDVLPLMPDFANDPALRAVARARADLWWDRPQEADAAVHSSDLTPAGDAIACLVRWRRRETSPRDPGLMTRSMKLNPDALAECLLARAMARAAVGKPAKALDDLESAERELAGRSLFDFRNAQILQLTRAARVLVLLQAGRRNEALQTAQRLKPTLRAGLLPQILVEEMLARQ